MWGMMNNVAKGVSNTTNSVAKGVSSTANNVSKGVVHGANQVGKGIAQGANQVGKAFNSGASWTGQQIENTVNECHDQMVQKVTDQLEKKFKKKARQVIKKAVTKVMRKCLTRFMTKGAAKKVPLAGFVFGMSFAAERALKGDFKGAGMEFSSGTMASVPVVGSGTSCVIDIALLSYDVEKEVGGELN